MADLDKMQGVYSDGFINQNGVFLKSLVIPLKSETAEEPPKVNGVRTNDDDPDNPFMEQWDGTDWLPMGGGGSGGDSEIDYDTNF